MYEKNVCNVALKLISFWRLLHSQIVDIAKLNSTASKLQTQMLKVEKQWKWLSKVNKYDIKLINIKYYYMIHVVDREYEASNWFNKIQEERYHRIVRGDCNQKLEHLLFEKSTAILYIALDKMNFGKIIQCNR